MKLSQELVSACENHLNSTLTCLFLTKDAQILIFISI